MITRFCAARGGVVVYLEDKDGMSIESAIVLSVDAGETICLSQRDQGVVLPLSHAAELIKAIKQIVRDDK